MVAAIAFLRNMHHRHQSTPSDTIVHLALHMETMVWPHDKSLAKLLGLLRLLGCLGILDFRIHHKVCFWGGELEPPGTQNN